MRPNSGRRYLPQLDPLVNKTANQSMIDADGAKLKKIINDRAKKKQMVDKKEDEDLMKQAKILIEESK